MVNDDFLLRKTFENEQLFSINPSLPWYADIIPFFFFFYRNVRKYIDFKSSYTNLSNGPKGYYSFLDH